MTMISTDSIRKQILLAAPRQRVWDAIADARRFGQWFGVDIDGAFAPGALVHGRFLDPQYAHIPFNITIERIEPLERLAWRWYPQAAIDPTADHSTEHATLVEFELLEQPDGVLLTIVESGFDALPAAFRVTTYRGNEDGWTQQLQNIARYVGNAA
jgi:uncharacterized protein YndB with AHSA1/START domain